VEKLEDELDDLKLKLELLSWEEEEQKNVEDDDVDEEHNFDDIEQT